MFGFRFDSIDWGGLIRGALGVLSAIGAGIAVYFGVKQATQTVEKVNETRKEEEKVTVSQEIGYCSNKVSDTCQKYGTVMSSAANLITALDSIINPEKQFQNPYNYNGCFNNYNNAGNMFGYFGQQQLQGYNSRYYGPCMAMEAAHYLSNNQIPPFPLPPPQYDNSQNNPYGPTVVRDFPGGVHTITVPGPGGGTAICM